MQNGSSPARKSSAGSLSNKDALSTNQQQLLEASMVAEQLAKELQAREAALQKQGEDITHLQETLWTTEDALRGMHLKSLEAREGELFNEARNSSGSSITVQAEGRLGKLEPQLKLLAASAGTVLG